MDVESAKKLDVGIQPEGYPELKPWTASALSSRLIECIETGASDIICPWDIDELEGIMRLLGVEDLSGRVSSLYYRNTMGGSEDKIIKNPEFGPDTYISVLFEGIADYGSTGDYPNDFMVGVVAELDETIDIALLYTCEEEAIICDECFETGGATLRDHFSCDHHEGEYDYDKKYAIRFFSKENTKEAAYWFEVTVPIDSSDEDKTTSSNKV